MTGQHRHRKAAAFVQYHHRRVRRLAAAVRRNGPHRNAHGSHKNKGVALRKLQGGPPGKGDAAAAAAVHTAGQGVCQPPGQCQTGVGKGQIGPGHWSDPLRNSVVKPGSYSLLRSYRVPRKSPTTMRAVLVMPAALVLSAREPTVHRTTLCSGQVAL